MEGKGMEYLGPAILILRRRQVDGQRRGVARSDQQRRGRHEEADGRLRRIDDGLAEAQTEAQLAASAASADLQRLTQPQFRLLAGGQTRLQIIFSFQSRVQTELECRPTSFSRKTKSKKKRWLIGLRLVIRGRIGSWSSRNWILFIGHFTESALGTTAIGTSRCRCLFWVIFTISIDSIRPCLALTWTATLKEKTRPRVWFAFYLRQSQYSIGRVAFRRSQGRRVLRHLRKESNQ